MKIYSGKFLTNKKSLYDGTVGFPMTIESAKFVTRPNCQKEVLELGLRSCFGKESLSYSYRLFRKNIQDKFLMDMGTENKKIKEMLGKRVIGFFCKYKNLYGLGIVDEN